MAKGPEAWLRLGDPFPAWVYSVEHNAEGVDQAHPGSLPRQNADTALL
jgi:hypothetical protein